MLHVIGLNSRVMLPSIIKLQYIGLFRIFYGEIARKI
jgi:hypothetical protein